jgi:hypothetical protein
MTVAAGGGAAGAGAAAGVTGAGVSVVVDGCCALALTKPLIQIANTVTNSDDVCNRFMGFLPGDALHPEPVVVPVWLKRNESVTTVPFAVKANAALTQCEASIKR